MEKYRQMLRQALVSDLSSNRIAAQRGLSHHTVRRWLAIARARQVTIAELDAMSHSELRAMFKSAPTSRAGHVEPDWEAEAKLVRSGLTRAEAHAEYEGRIGRERAFRYRSYCERLAAYVKTLDPVLRLEHVAGYEMQTDFAGDLVPGREVGGQAPVRFKLFVAALPFSRLAAAHLVRTERVDDHIEANIAALEYFGGALVVARPDNLKAAVVSRPRFGPPKIQERYQAFLDHYNMGADPARPGKPQDKGAVENAVKLVQRMVRLRLRNRPLLDIAALRVVLAEVVETINNRVLRRAGGHSRRTLFEAEERRHLRPLPAERFEPFDRTRECRIHRDYHVEFRGSYYSVPYRLIGNLAMVKPTATKVEIIVDGRTVALHPRAREQGAVVSDPAHRPENHAAIRDVDLVAWARRYGDCCTELAKVEAAEPRTLHQRQSREKWITSLPRRHGKQRFLAACERAVSLGDLRFEHVENVLKRGIERSMPANDTIGPIAPTLNVRGPGYYAPGDE